MFESYPQHDIRTRDDHNTYKKQRCTYYRKSFLIHVILMHKELWMSVVAVKCDFIGASELRTAHAVDRNHETDEAVF